MANGHSMTGVVAWVARRVFPPSPRRKFIGLEFKSKIRTPWRVRLAGVARCMPRGFLSESSSIYDFTTYSMSDHLSDFGRVRAFFEHHGVVRRSAST